MLKSVSFLTLVNISGGLKHQVHHGDIHIQLDILDIDRSIFTVQRKTSAVELCYHSFYSKIYYYIILVENYMYNDVSAHFNVGIIALCIMIINL